MLLFSGFRKNTLRYLRCYGSVVKHFYKKEVGLFGLDADKRKKLKGLELEIIEIQGQKREME
jgi:hypothetical protein